MSVDKYSEVVVSELTALKDRIAANIMSSGENASGRTIESLEVVEDGHSFRLLGRLAFGTLETGRKAGKVPATINDIIKQWAIDKGIKADPIPYIRKPSEKWQPKYTPQQRGDMSMVGAIVHKIKTEGTRLYRDGGRNDIYSPQIDETINTIQERLAVIFKTEVIDSIKLN